MRLLNWPRKIRGGRMRLPSFNSFGPFAARTIDVPDRFLVLPRPLLSFRPHPHAARQQRDGHDDRCRQ